MKPCIVPRMAGISQAIFSLVGVLIGGGITTAGTVWTQRTQLRNAIATEARNRDITAAATAITALGKLLHVADDGRPDENRGSGQQRDELLLQLATAAQDLRNADLRLRVTEAYRILTEHTAAWSIAGQPESVSRKIACEYGIDCLGAFRRGEPVPPMPEQFTATIAAIEQWTPPKQVRPTR
jgi:hypothetical protein